MLSEREVDKIPDKNFLNFFLKEKGIECSIRDFCIGEEADNGFLEVNVYSPKYHQTSIDITEEEYKKIKSGYYNKELNKIPLYYTDDYTIYSLVKLDNGNYLITFDIDFEKVIEFDYDSLIMFLNGQITIWSDHSLNFNKKSRYKKTSIDDIIEFIKNKNKKHGIN